MVYSYLRRGLRLVLDIRIMNALLDVRGGRNLETSGQVNLLDEVCCTKDPGGSWKQARTRGRVGVQAANPGSEVSLR